MARSGIEPDRPNVAIPSLPSIHVRCEYGIAGRITGKNPRGDLPVIHDRAFVDSTAILCGRVLVHENVLAQRWVAITVLPMNPVCMVATGGAACQKVRLKLEPRGGCHAIHHTDTVARCRPRLMRQAIVFAPSISNSAGSNGKAVIPAGLFQ